MTQLQPSPESGSGGGRPSSGLDWRAFVGWVLGIVGGIAAFMGGFILLAGDDQYVGLGGSLSWRVGDLGPAWGVALLAGGIVVLLIGLGLVISAMRSPRPGVVDHGLRDLQVHTGAFVLVNAFLWVQDFVISGSIDYAYLITIAWGAGLVGHAVAYYVSHHSQRPGAPQPR